MAERFDISTSKKWRVDDNQNLIVEATPTRAGIFKYYENENGKIKVVKELRHPDQVFSRETLDSLKNIPYTIQSNHTSLFSTKDTTGKAYGVTLSEVDRDGDLTKCKIKVWDHNEIKEITGGGSLELSNGYRCDTNEPPAFIYGGTYNGEKYDREQVNIRYNHVARVEKARGGDSCRIRLDADCAICGIEAERLDSGNYSNSHKEETMTTETKEKVKILQRELPARASGDFRLDALQIEVEESQKPLVDSIKSREDAIFNFAQKLADENTKAQVKLDQLTKENAELSKKLENSVPSERMDSELENRLALLHLAEKVGIKEAKSMAPSELGKAIVKESKMFNEEKLDNADYVKFAIEHLQDTSIQNKLKSRQNLEQSFKIDAYDGDDLSKPSRLEIS